MIALQIMLHCNQELEIKALFVFIVRQTYCSWKEAALAHFEKLPDSPITIKFHGNDNDNGGNNHNVMVLHLYLLWRGMYLYLLRRVVGKRIKSGSSKDAVSGESGWESTTQSAPRSIHHRILHQHHKYKLFKICQRMALFGKKITHQTDPGMEFSCPV